MYKNNVCALGSTVAKKWFNLRTLYFDSTGIDISKSREYYLWTLPKEFINWLKIYVKGWEG